MKVIKPLLVAVVAFTALFVSSVAQAAPAQSSKIANGWSQGVFSDITSGTTTATVTNCTGVGLMPVDLQYGTCTTDQTAGTGSVVFTAGGRTVSLSSKPQKNGAYASASYWSSNSSVDYLLLFSPWICVGVKVTQIAPKGGYYSNTLVVSHDGSSHTDEYVVGGKGTYTYCYELPFGSSNVWWQLVSITSATTSGQAQLTQTLLYP